MSDLHAFDDAFKVVDDAVAYVAKVKARGWKFTVITLISDLGDIRQIASDVQKVAGEVTDFATEVKNLSVDDVQKVAARAVSTVYTVIRIFAPVAAKVVVYSGKAA